MSIKLPSHLYWEADDHRLTCKVHYPAHTIAFDMMTGSQPEDDENLTAFLSEHAACIADSKGDER